MHPGTVWFHWGLTNKAKVVMWWVVRPIRPGIEKKDKSSDVGLLTALIMAGWLTT